MRCVECIHVRFVAGSVVHVDHLQFKTASTLTLRRASSDTDLRQMWATFPSDETMLCFLHDRNPTAGA